MANTAVLVGVDGSDSALVAVRLAAREASQRNCPLRVLHAFIWPLIGVPGGPVAEGPPDTGLRHQAEEMVDNAVNLARSTAPGLHVTGEIIDGEASVVLLNATQEASLVVLGDRGLGGFSALLLGSVAIQVSAYAHCPVLVARGVQRSTGPVVVGVDGSDLSTRAVTYAADTAARRGTDLIALHAYRHPTSLRPGDMQPLVYDDRALHDDEARLLAEATTGLTERRPQLRVTRRTVHARSASALVEASRDAQLVVVGSRGRGGFSGLVLGSVSHAVLHHATCPVAIVRPDD